MIRRSMIFRLSIPLLLAVTLVALVLIFGDASRQKVVRAQRSLAEEMRITLHMSELRSISRSLQRDGLNLIVEPDAAEHASIESRFDKRIGQFEAELAAIPRHLDGEPDTMAADFRRTQHAVLENLIAVRRSRSKPEAHIIFRTRVRPAERHASIIADGLIARSMDRGEALRAHAVAIERSERWLLLLVAIGLSLVALGGGVAMVLLTVIRPLKDIRVAMDKLAAGDTATAIPHIKRADAIGRMARAIAIFHTAAHERDALLDAAEASREAEAEQARRAKFDAEHRDDLERQRRALLGELAQAVNDNLATVNDKLRASAARLFRSAGEVKDHAAVAGREAELTALAADQVTNELAAASSTSLQVGAAVGDLQGQAVAATEAVDRAVARSRAATQRMAALGANADRVAEVMQVIKAVAHKSRLLALNATIEAARAGDVGRGFTIVANEMKSLAQQTANAATRVEAQLEDIRGAASEGGAALAEIEDAVGQIEQNAALLLGTMTQQSAASSEIGRGMEIALADIRQVGGRMTALGATARGTESVAGALLADAETLSDDAAEVDTALRNLVARLKAA